MQIAHPGLEFEREQFAERNGSDLFTHFQVLRPVSKLFSSEQVDRYPVLYKRLLFGVEHKTRVNQQLRKCFAIAAIGIDIRRRSPIAMQKNRDAADDSTIDWFVFKKVA